MMSPLNILSIILCFYSNVQCLVVKLLWRWCLLFQWYSVSASSHHDQPSSDYRQSMSWTANDSNGFSAFLCRFHSLSREWQGRSYCTNWIGNHIESVVIDFVLEVEGERVPLPLSTSMRLHWLWLIVRPC